MSCPRAQLHTEPVRTLVQAWWVHHNLEAKFWGNHPFCINSLNKKDAQFKGHEFFFPVISSALLYPSMFGRVSNSVRRPSVFIA